MKEHVKTNLKMWMNWHESLTQTKTTHRVGMYSHERMTWSMMQDEQETMGEHEHAINRVVGSGMMYPHGCAMM